MIDALLKRIDALNNPTVVGLDPTMDYIPEMLRREAFDRSGETLEGAAEAIIRRARSSAVIPSALQM